MTGKLVGTGHKVGRLFILETLEVSKSINARLAASVLESSSFSLWHSRLGHISMPRLKYLLSSGKLGPVKSGNFSHCISCKLAK